MEQVQKIANQLRNEYAKKWRESNKDKVKKANENYWQKKAKEQIEQKGE